jgi:chaperone required for assembly of F1-ATPase
VDKSAAAPDIWPMSKTPRHAWFPVEDGEDRPDPVRLVQQQGRPPLPRRVYKEAGVAERDGGLALVLDGRPARTPAKRFLALPSRRAAEALAAEWNAQAEVLDPAAMPLTRLVNSALDGVAADPEGVRADLLRYAASDLLCYRAGDPARLVERQSTAWDPVLDWAHDALGARFILADGVMFAQQPERALAAVGEALAGLDSPLALAALHTMTSLTGSVLLALAVARRQLTAAQAWTAAHVDEDYQAELWGADDEAMERRAARWREMDAAARLFALA